MRPRYSKHDSRTRWLGTCIGLTQIRSQKPQLRLFNVIGTLIAMVERRRRVLEICCAKSGDGAPPPRNPGLHGLYNVHHADPVTGFTSAARGKALGHCVLQVSASSSGDQAGLARSPVVVELDRWLGSRTKGYLPLPGLGRWDAVGQLRQQSLHIPIHHYYGPCATYTISLHPYYTAPQRRNLCGEPTKVRPS